jgi:hypothetical protein
LEDQLKQRNGLLNLEKLDSSELLEWAKKIQSLVKERLALTEPSDLQAMNKYEGILEVNRVKLITQNVAKKCSQIQSNIDSSKSLTKSESQINQSPFV